MNGIEWVVWQAGAVDLPGDAPPARIADRVAAAITGHAFLSTARVAEVAGCTVKQARNSLGYMLRCERAESVTMNGVTGYRGKR